MYSSAFLILMAGCGHIVKFTTVRDKIEMLAWEDEHKEAERYLNDQLQKNQTWCVNAYDVDKCRLKTAHLPKVYEKQLRKIIKCNEVFLECRAQKISRQKGEKCVEELQKYCARKRDGEYFFENEKSREYGLFAAIKRKVPSLLYDINTAENKEFAAAVNKCLSNFYWGFYRSKKAYDHMPVNAVLIKNYLTGKFDSKISCDKARQDFPIKYRRVVRNDICERRYVGEDVLATIYSFNGERINLNGSVKINEQIFF